jgi:hypothetical protein
MLEERKKSGHGTRVTLRIPLFPGAATGQAGTPGV